MNNEGKMKRVSSTTTELFATRSYVFTMYAAVAKRGWFGGSRRKATKDGEEEKTHSKYRFL